MKRLSSLYHFGYNRDFVDVKVKASIKGPYLTDPSFYVPSTEASKVQSTYDAFNGAYDDYQVPDALVDLRRPGNDISESVELVNQIREDFNDKISTTNAELGEKAKATAQSLSDDANRQSFIDNLMATPSEK